MNILFLGDIVAKSGRCIVLDRLPHLKTQYKIDLTIVNGENAAHGKGITKKIYNSFVDAGVDVITLGNHSFSKGEFKLDIDSCEKVIRPYNLNCDGIGNGYYQVDVNGLKVAVVNLVGHIFMDCATMPPHEAMDEILPQLDADIILVDLHAEATAEKQTFLHLMKDKVTGIVGTHTHIQTADEMIYDGCAYITDVGMCGTFDSILGRDTDEILSRILYNEKTHFVPAEGPAILCGCVITVDDETKRATNIIRIQERP